ncbi:MAG: hypothetical protein ACI4ON_04095 [Clostridia bacterium]
MKKGIFSSWFREFATLVLTQTVQAFLLAIVMSVIISCLAEAGKDSVNAAGLLAIIALSSFNKIELLVKNIFGVTSQYGPSLDNGARGLMGTAMAFRGMKNISDNAGKAIKGARLKREGEAGLKALNANGGKMDTSKLNPDTTTDSDRKTLGEETGRSVEEQVVKLQTMGDIGELTTAIRNLTKATETGNKNDSQSKMEKYQDMINQGRDMQKSALHESVGATIGGAAGAIYGMAKGDDIGKSALAGAGMGDTAGKAISQYKSEKESYKGRMEKLADIGEKNFQDSMTEIENFKKQAVKNVVSGKVENVSEYNKMVADAVNEYKQGINNNMNAAVKNAYKPSKSVKDSQKRLNNIHKNLDKNSTAGNH